MPGDGRTLVGQDVTEPEPELPGTGEGTLIDLAPREM